jgi:aspartate/methionine/tyrosine aminotransferase
MPCPLWLARLLIRTGIARLLPSVQRLTDGGVDFLHYYADRVLVSPMQELRDASPYLAQGGADLIDLCLGAPRFDLLPPGTIKLPAEQRGYPPPTGLRELRELIAEKLRGEHGVNLAADEEVLITGGATAALSYVLDTFVSPGDRVVLLDPTYLMYPLAVRHRRGRVRWLPTEIEQGRIRFAEGEAGRMLRGARLVLVNSPSNPTGGVIAPEDMEQLAWWCDRHDVLLFSDEVYQAYQYDGRFTSIGAMAKARRRTLTANSLSKSHALAAYRVGWLAGHRHLLRPCAATAALQCPFVPTICQQLALIALRLPAEAFEPIHAEFRSRRHYVHERLQAMGLRPPWPAGGFFFWLPVSTLRLTGLQFAERLLCEKRVLLMPGEWFGPSGRGYVRLSYALEDGRLREGLNRLAEFMRQLAPLATPVEVRQAA